MGPVLQRHRPIFCPHDLCRTVTMEKQALLLLKYIIHLLNGLTEVGPKLVETLSIHSKIVYIDKNFRIHAKKNYICRKYKYEYFFNASYKIINGYKISKLHSCINKSAVKDLRHNKELINFGIKFSFSKCFASG